MRKLSYIFLSVIFLCALSEESAAEKKRIISLAPAITEIIYALQAEDLLVGVSSYCDYPAEAKAIEKVGGFINPNIEKIISLKPDMVILSPNSGTKMVEESLRRLGIPNRVVSFYTIKELLASFVEIGILVGKETEGRALERQLQNAIHDIESNVQLKARPKILFVREHTPLYVAGEKTYEDDLITIAGGDNCIDGGRERYPHYTMESVIALNPDTIIDATYYETPSPAQKAEIKNFWAQFKGISALENKNIFIIKTDIHSVPGPRTYELLYLLAEIVHPDIFAGQSELSERIIE
jgi:iron complex transport system substrate-binding protein